MIWATIPPDRLQYMSLFGYDLVSDENGIAWYNGPNGRHCIDKANPLFAFDDVSDAMQAGAHRYNEKRRPVSVPGGTYRCPLRFTIPQNASWLFYSADDPTLRVSV